MLEIYSDRRQSKDKQCEVGGESLREPYFFANYNQTDVEILMGVRDSIMLATVNLLLWHISGFFVSHICSCSEFLSQSAIAAYSDSHLIYPKHQSAGVCCCRNHDWQKPFELILTLLYRDTMHHCMLYTNILLQNYLFILYIYCGVKISQTSTMYIFKCICRMNAEKTCHQCECSIIAENYM